MTNSNLDRVTDPDKFMEIEERSCDRNTVFSSKIHPEKRDCAIYIENVSKSYDKTPILRNLCMNVKKGTIYGLLGSSGCGKTITLSCIIGLETWNSGDILVFGKKPGCRLSSKKIGYMPQDLALYRHLTIREIIQFYGQIYNMPNSEIKSRYDFLCELLELPIKSTQIGDLSGGEKRRASLALAMIHSPELLVLDEPTVGVDPLLRKNIWDYLYKLVNSTGTTVLITTHYIEEARHSNTIGVMRKGRLLVEDTPSNILSNYNCHLLEEAVVHLCRDDQSKSKNPTTNQQSKQIKFKNSSFWKQKLLPRNSIREEQESECNIGEFRIRKDIGIDHEITCENPKYPKRVHETNSYSDSKIQKFHMGLRKYAVVKCSQRVVGLTKVKLLTFLRNPIFFAIIILVPTFQAVLTLLTIGALPKDVHLGIVNQELRNWSMECLLPKHSSNSCDLSFLSCKYLSHLGNGNLLALDSFESENQARAHVHNGNLLGYVTIPNTFSESSVELATSRLFASNESIIGSRIHAHLDHSDFILASLTVKHLLLTYMSFVQNVGKSCDFEGELGNFPLHFRPPVYGTYEDSFEGFIIPGIVANALFGLAVVLTSVSHVSEKCEGTLTRAKTAGLSTLDIICSHLMTQVIVAIIQIIIWNVILHFVFHFVIMGSPWLWILFCLVSELLGAGLGLLIGQVLKNETEVLLVDIFLYTFVVFCGCMFLPVEYMDNFWRQVAYLVAIYLPTESLRSIVVRGVGITHFSVWLGLVSAAAWMAVVLVFVVIAFNIM